MATAKEHIAELIKRQPDNSSYDEIVRDLASHIYNYIAIDNPHAAAQTVTRIYERRSCLEVTAAWASL